MGTSIRAKGINAEAFATEFAAKVRRGLRGIYFTNESLTKARHNYAPANINPEAVNYGADPTPSTNYTTFYSGALNPQGSASLDTRIPETVEQTVFLVQRAKDSNLWPDTPTMDAKYRTMSLSSWGVTEPGQGAALYYTSKTRISFVGGISDGPTSTSYTIGVAANPVEWQLISARIKEGQITIKNHTQNVSASATNVNPRRLSGRTMLLGGVYSVSYGGIVDIAVAQIHDVFLTDAEESATVASIRAYCLRRGITV